MESVHPNGLPVTEGAVAAPLVPLGQIAARFAADPGATLGVSDVHGDVERLEKLLRTLGVTDASGERIPGRGRVIQLGDLVDGRRAGDYDALVLGQRVFDAIVIGNHEAALLGGPTFDGMLMAKPEIRDGLRSMARRGQLVVAERAGDVLLSHAGVSAGHGLASDPAQVVSALEDPFYEFCGRESEQDPLLFAIDPRRGGAGARGGVLWQDWASLLTDPAPGYRQLVGHSRVGAPEQDPDGRIVCLDPAGAGLGVALIGADGRLDLASDA